MNRARLAIGYTAEPSGHVGEACPAMSKYALANTLTVTITDTHMVVFGRPIDAYEPDSAVNHVIVLAANRAAAISTYPCTGAQWRCLPTGLQVAATRQGTGPPQVAHRKIGAQGVIGRSRRVGSVLRTY